MIEIEASVAATNESFEKAGIPYRIDEKRPAFCDCDIPHPCCEWCMRCIVCREMIYGYVLATVYRLGYLAAKK